VAGEPTSSRDRVRAHRERLRCQGLRPIQIWVPDVTTPEFAAEARRQMLAIATSEEEVDDMAFLESLVDELPWEDALELDDWQSDSK